MRCIECDAADIERAGAMWTMLRTMARLALERCDEALPTAAPPS
jgi:hypothetical protein